MEQIDVVKHALTVSGDRIDIQRLNLWADKLNVRESWVLILRGREDCAIVVVDQIPGLEGFWSTGSRLNDDDSG